ncbi:HEAT repeat domain-containing protein [Bdellovibrio svalbardensis]|uniref:HEAT repeat domain-containing protein n=1 Tax=Bdellovibrio svalbardensis TaxID=2972972 RepID=A0ABT6DGG3_9BACT|nr:HEAT repeat domain-containing protein [Bdellovibrio svalbardensis]MDG0815932.1 HEAT repeat domain-containing protein [Bdellovibrio svalbardensis]
MKTKIVASLLIAGFSSSAFAALTKPSSSTLTSAAEMLKLPTENRRNALMGKGDKFYSSFISIAFNDAQPMSLRWRALMAAAEAGGDKATADLMKAGDHSQWYMRNAALVALSEVNPSQGVKLAQKLIKDKALVVRSAAVEVLDKSATAEVRDLLWEELNQTYNFKGAQSLWIRHQIVEVLAKKPKDHELKIFASLLSDKDTRVQLPAVGGLEKLTGTKLGEGPMKQSELIGLWKNYVKKENIAL